MYDSCCLFAGASPSARHRPRRDKVNLQKDEVVFLAYFLDAFVQFLRPTSISGNNSCAPPAVGLRMYFEVFRFEGHSLRTWLHVDTPFPFPLSIELGGWARSPPGCNDGAVVQSLGEWLGAIGVPIIRSDVVISKSPALSFRPPRVCPLDLTKLRRRAKGAQLLHSGNEFPFRKKVPPSTLHRFYVGSTHVPVTLQPPVQ